MTYASFERGKEKSDCIERSYKQRQKERSETVEIQNYDESETKNNN